MYQTRGICIRRLSMKINYLKCIKTRGICIRRLSIKINYLKCIKRMAYVSEGCPWKWASLYLYSEWYMYKIVINGNKLLYVFSIYDIYISVRRLTVTKSYLTSRQREFQVPKWCSWIKATLYFSSFSYSDQNVFVKISCLVTWKRYHKIYNENKLPCICSL